MNCKKCIHFDVCVKAKNPENYKYPECKDFKEKEVQRDENGKTLKK